MAVKAITRTFASLKRNVAVLPVLSVIGSDECFRLKLILYLSCAALRRLQLIINQRSTHDLVHAPLGAS